MHEQDSKLSNVLARDDIHFCLSQVHTVACTECSAVETLTPARARIRELGVLQANLISHEMSESRDSLKSASFIAFSVTHAITYYVTHISVIDWKIVEGECNRLVRHVCEIGPSCSMGRQGNNRRRLQSHCPSVFSAGGDSHCIVYGRCVGDIVILLMDSTMGAATLQRPR